MADFESAVSKTIKNEFKPIPGYEGIYAATKKGNIWSFRSNKFLKPNIGTNGYEKIVLSHKNKLKTFSVHRLIALSFIDNPMKNPCINHLDGNKLNNATNNLEWVTYSKNNKHAYDTGLKISVKGESCYLHGKTGKNNHMYGKPHPNRKKIINLETNKVFDSIAQASFENNIDRSTIRSHLKGSLLKIKWRYYEDKQ